MKLNNTLIKMTTSSAMAAIICAVTMAVSIPLPTYGYANLGDCFVLVCGILLGPVWGAAAAGIGSALADLLLGYGIYAPATLVIKSLMALVAYFLYTAITKGSRLNHIALIPSAISAEALMVAGYFTFESIIYGFEGALPNILGNSVQGAVCAICAVFVLSVLIRAGLYKKISSRFTRKDKNT